jgi:hypothetical protein
MLPTAPRRMLKTKALTLYHHEHDVTDKTEQGITVHTATVAVTARHTPPGMQAAAHCAAVTL